MIISNSSYRNLTGFTLFSRPHSSRLHTKSKLGGKSTERPGKNQNRAEIEHCLTAPLAASWKSTLSVRRVRHSQEATVWRALFKQSSSAQQQVHSSPVWKWRPACCLISKVVGAKRIYGAPWIGLYDSLSRTKCYSKLENLREKTRVCTTGSFITILPPRLGTPKFASLSRPWVTVLFGTSIGGVLVVQDLTTGSFPTPPPGSRPFL